MTLVCLGLLAVAFVPFQLWGTALFQYETQAHLRHELRKTIGPEPAPPLPASAAAAGTAVPVGLAAHLAPVTTTPPVGSPIGLLSIPKIGLSQVVVEGVGEAQLRGGPGHYPSTPLPGQPGNASLAGHRTTYAAPFSDLNLLAPGDFVYVRTAQGLFRYSVVRSLVVDPTDVAVLDSAPPASTLTLTTCNPRYSAAQRLVVVAAFSGDTPTGAAAPATPTRAPAPAAVGATHAADLGGSGGGILLVVVWGVAALAAVVLTRLAWVRTGTRWRWAVTTFGTAVIVAAVFVLFDAASQALPASF